MDLKIIDNFLEKSIFNNIKDILLSNKFDWYYQNFVGNDKDSSDFFFCHYLFKEDRQSSPYFSSILIPIIGKLNFSYLYRAKINLYTKKNEIIKTAFHNDMENKHFVDSH